jgi:YebC/PmpR family DNA-binding regulatory protein
MSGHSKWHSIKHKKARVDAKRGNIFTKIIKEITVAARIAGGNPDMNPRLRTAIAKAKGENMPQDNITRAIKKGTGELPGVSYEEYIYEGYGPAGVAVMVEVLTDNKNRTVSEIRYIFSKHNGNLGEAGCVGWMFEKKGVILIDRSQINEDQLMEIVLDAGADDINAEGSEYEITTMPEKFEEVKSALEAKNVSLSMGEVSMVPQSTIKLEGKQAQQMLALMEKLEEHDDVQNVYANFDIPDEVLASM